MTTPKPRLFAHTRGGIVAIPETGDARADELLDRIVRRAGARGHFTVTTADGEIYTADPDRDARRALREGA